MRPTLDAGDIVWCWRTKPSAVKRADIVVFQPPNIVEKGIKRVVGLPDDNVSYSGKRLTIDGSLAVKRLKQKLPGTDPADLLFEQIVFGRSFDVLESYGQSLTENDSKPGLGYFLMGDNRDASIDSRHFGRVVEGRIQCKALAVVATASGRFLLDIRWL